MLGNLARQLGLGNIIIISRHIEDKCNGRTNPNILEDSFELYKSIMQFIYNYDEKEIVVNEINFNPIEYNTYFEYLKTPVKSINYAIRPRIGVKDPGEVYTVIKDQVKVYGVPFDFNEYTIPIYSEDLKERVDNGFVVIEGLCVFQKTSPENNITSDSYINIEYKDSADNCFEYSAKQVECPEDDSLITEIPMQIDK